MPIYEGYCNNHVCSSFGKEFEFLLNHWSAETKPCPECKTTLNRLIGKPNVVWAKPLGWYGGGTEEGHMVYGTKDGEKYTKYITTRQEQLEYCKSEGLKDPLEIDRDRGLNEKGQEQAVQKYGKECRWI